MIFSKEIFFKTFGFYPSKQFSGIEIDSRKVKPGNIFFCIKGKINDGHDFAKEALEKGASYIVVSKPISIAFPAPESIQDTHTKLSPHNASFNHGLVYKTELIKENQILTKDTEEVLTRLLINLRNSIKSTILAITGSCGKTSTKEKILCAFKEKDILGTPGNYNTILGLAIFLSSIEKEPEYLALELGINKPNEMDEISAIIKPHYSIITSIGPAHIGNFKNVNHIRSEKLKIAKHTQKITFVPKDTNKAIIETLNCSVIKEEDLKSKTLDSLADQDFTHNAILKISDEEKLKHARKNIKSYSTPKGRNNLVKIKFDDKEITLIDGSYNCNPMSLQFSLSKLESFSIYNCKKENIRKIAIIGEMKELGKHTQKYHELDLNFKGLLILLEETPNLWKTKKGMIFKDWVQICHFLKQNIQDKDVILAKGSNSTDIKKITQWIEDLQKSKYSIK
ncbi:Mur ligase family protein [Candidatus Nesciobacter abundans]|uniref:UDP-N-acetylmuramoyl-tripeptide--D-alanyl-D-alanine ligase n=1 Tax=Candidatus Nesciobacter abundans TaxID=2601668 RepID=A0A5C0UGJ8_9PROT|nr:UDP-N-acetylmuramoyl-tripeptide--D-alanyl-D-alanine ligase [Candidatus Nesciobacter abundans]QEK39246.1 UDP-N-acetylmuramoyl-tripeptide--D-alanyl-D-alanine ligase [Candidatus Nesciobacter abundans]